MNLKITILILALFSVGTRPEIAEADYHQYYIRTVEWLTTNSETIVIVENAEDQARPTVTLTLKGSFDSIEWPLKVDGSEQKLYAPPSGGRIELLFIGANSLLLQSVRLDREPLVARQPTIHNSLYGVNHFGEIILTESQLTGVIADHLNTKPTRELKQIRAKNRKHLACLSPHYDKSGVSAPRQFPLETNGETYVLIVSLDEARRDHFLNVIRTGNASDRIHAIWELSQFDDPTARQAIKNAINCINVQPSYERDSNGVISKVSTKDVNQYAIKLGNCAG